MVRRKDLECCDTSVQHLILTSVFSETYQAVVSGATCYVFVILSSVIQEGKIKQVYLFEEP